MKGCFISRSATADFATGTAVARKHFDFCAAMHRLCADICGRHSAFAHIDMERVVVTYAQTRSPVEWGMMAKLTPMRLEGGALTEVRDGRKWTCQRVMHNGREMLYMLTFYLPRFQNQTYQEKLVTVFHELYHISQSFDGDIRRFAGSCYMHTGSQANYDRQMEVFLGQYVEHGAPERLREFLKYDFSVLSRIAGTVIGLRLPIPRMVPVEDVA